ncbi:MAG: penicillin-binding protein activator LpoB [Treponema sp.]|nr:penicillin-binding protein activator LpoB [Treponema sp.]
MKKLISVIALVALVCSAVFAAKVKRVDSDKMTDVDGYWNDNDVKIVCESLIKQCLESPRVAKKCAVIEDRTGDIPVAIIGKIKNDSTEHIDTSIIEAKFRNAIINSGVIDFVASKNERELLRDEKEDQTDYAADAKAIGAETAADFMLLGSVKSMVQSDGKTGVRAYQVNAQLVDIETNKIIWSGEDDSVKKVIKNAKVKL